MKNQDWKIWRFDEMAFNVNDRLEPADTDLEHYVGLEHLDSDSLKIRRWGTPDDVEATKLRFKEGDIIFGRRRAYQRKLAVADFDGICSAHAMVLRAKPQVVLSEFLPFFMQSGLFMNRAVDISVGSLSPTINWKTLAAQEFALPPLEEQRRIAEVLEAAWVIQDNLQDAAFAAAKVWLALAHKYFSVSNSTNKSRSYDTASLGELVVYASDGPFGSKLKTEHYSNEGARVIRLQNIDRLKFNDEDRAFIPFDYYRRELAGYEVEPGDVLIAGLGDDNVPAGRACQAPNILGHAINKADCYCIRPNHHIDPRFLVAFLNSPVGLQQSAAFSQGTTRYRLNLGNIKRMRIPVPPMIVQTQMADHLEAIHSAELFLSQRCTDYSILFRALIDSLLQAS